MFFVNTSDQGILFQKFLVLGLRGPVVLRLEEKRYEVEVVFVRDAACDLAGLDRREVGREVREGQVQFARIDEVRLELLEAVLMEMSAVRAGEGGVFGHFQGASALPIVRGTESLAMSSAGGASVAVGCSISEDSAVSSVFSVSTDPDSSAAGGS